AAREPVVVIRGSRRSGGDRWGRRLVHRIGEVLVRGARGLFGHHLFADLRVGRGLGAGLGLGGGGDGRLAGRGVGLDRKRGRRLVRGRVCRGIARLGAGRIAGVGRRFGRSGFGGGFRRRCVRRRGLRFGGLRFGGRRRRRFRGVPGLRCRFGHGRFIRLRLGRGFRRGLCRGGLGRR